MQLALTDRGSAGDNCASALLCWLANHPFLSTFVSGCLLWFSMPPLANWTLSSINPLWSDFPILTLLAWFALIPILGLVYPQRLPDRSVRKIWLASWIYWAAILYFIPIPHWALWFGWIAMSLYLSIYIPLFIVAVRQLVHTFKWPIAVAAPVAWVGFEYFRSVFLTGFGMALIGHSQARIPQVIQIADLFGAYFVSFLIVFVAACLFACIFYRQVIWRAVYLGLGVAAIASTLVYGQFRLSEGAMLRESQQRTLRVAILQGNIDTVFPRSDREAEQLFQHKVDHYRELASSEKLWTPRHPNSFSFPVVDLLVWPEGKFPATDYLIESDQPQSRELAAKIDEMESMLRFIMMWMQSVEKSNDDPIDSTTNPMAIHSVVGTQTLNPVTDQIYNSVLLVDHLGEVQSRYLKNHRVMFGEYIPFENFFPILSRLTPQGKGLTPGTTAAAIEFRGFILCPNICFESCVPHLIRRHVNKLQDQDLEPDFIVNLSDDGWFYGSSCLDFHLYCSLFRAVEMRKPTIVAANTGLSANIDGNGRILDLGPRRKPEILLVEAKPDQRFSLYRKVGDWPAITCMLIGLASLAFCAMAKRKKPG